MAEYLSPGVYVEEYNSSSNFVDGVGTSTAGFVGFAEMGPTIGAPLLVKGFNEFTRLFGGFLSETTHGEYRYLSNCVEQFFVNGGTCCYVSRVIPEGAKAARGTFGKLSFQAVNEGRWGNDLKITIDIKQEELDIQLKYKENVEQYIGVNLSPASPKFLVRQMEKSKLIKIELEEILAEGDSLKAIIGIEETEDNKIAIIMEGGTDGELNKVTAKTFIGKDDGEGKRTGIQSFLENITVNTMAVPGITMPEVQLALVSHCEKLKNRFAVLDMPRDMKDTNELIRFRETIDSTYAAMYHPWIQTYDRSIHKPTYIPPSGAILGIYAKTDNQRGVHKAPANETIACTGLAINFGQEEQNSLNPKGINLIRAFPGQGIRVWGARTASSDATFKYVNVRRLFIFVEESIKANTSWVVFEPNDATLWSRVSLTISGFLNTLWRNGMLMGSASSEAFFVDIGPSTMTKDDIMNGRLICNIGIAPSRPAEFVIFRVQQYTAEA